MKERTGADATQIGGQHYKDTPPEYEHWNVAAALGWDYFTGQVTKYLWRWRSKNGVQDLKKAAHYLQKYIEVEEALERAGADDDGSEPGPGYVNQDR